MFLAAWFWLEQVVPAVVMVAALHCSAPCRLAIVRGVAGSADTCENRPGLSGP